MICGAALISLKEDYAKAGYKLVNVSPCVPYPLPFGKLRFNIEGDSDVEFTTDNIWETKKNVELLEREMDRIQTDSRNEKAQRYLDKGKGSRAKRDVLDWLDSIDWLDLIFWLILASMPAVLLVLG